MAQVLTYLMVNHGRREFFLASQIRTEWLPSIAGVEFVCLADAEVVGHISACQSALDCNSVVMVKMPNLIGMEERPARINLKRPRLAGVRCTSSRRQTSRSERSRPKAATFRHPTTPRFARQPGCHGWKSERTAAGPKPSHPTN